MWQFSGRTGCHSPTSGMAHSGCVFVAGIHPFGIWVSGCLQSWHTMHAYANWASCYTFFRKNWGLPLQRPCRDLVTNTPARLIAHSTVKQSQGAGMAQLVVIGLAVHSVAGSILLWGHFPVERIFPLELTWVQTPFPQKTPSDESIDRGLVCAHMHFIARTQKSWRSCPRRVNAGNKNTPSTHHPRRRNVTTLMVGLKNGHIRKNLTQKWWTPEI